MALTRRHLMRDATLLAGGLALGVRATPGAGAAAAGGLDPARRRTYAALVETVIAQPSIRLDPAWAATATEEFAAAYASWDAAERRRVDAVLDDLERSATGAFSRRDGEGRAAHLRACAHLAGGDPAGAEQARLRLVDAAMALVARAVGPADADDRSVVTI